jgi:hypothetical protein
LEPAGFFWSLNRCVFLRWFGFICTASTGLHFI